MKQGLITTAILLGLASCQSSDRSSAPLPDSVLAELRAGAASLRLDADTVTLPLVGTPTLPLVAGYLNGQGPFNFLIDLGSNVVIVRRDVAEASHARILVDRETTDIVAFDSLRLGDARFDRVVAGVYDTLDVDGVLGYNLLQASSFTLDYPRQRLILSRLSLAEPDDQTVFSYEVVNRLPYVKLRLGTEFLSVNLDTGAAEFMTIPPSFRDRIRWSGSLHPGPKLWNNQTGATTVLRGEMTDTAHLGAIALEIAEVYVNEDADMPWIGSAAMQRAAWTFDPAHRRLEVTLATRKQ